MKRGEIYYAQLSPTVGKEVSKRRPVLIVSNDINNRVASYVTILPITFNITRIYPFEVLLEKGDSGLPLTSKVQAQQIRTISKQRIERDVLGTLKSELMSEIEAAIRLHLGL